MSCPVTSRHATSRNITSRHVVSCQVMSRYVRSGHVMLCLTRFLSYLGPSWALCWPLGPSLRLRRPILGAMLAHLGAYVGLFNSHQKRLKKQSQKKPKIDPKTALASGLRGTPGHSGGPESGPNRGIFVNIACQHPEVHHKRLETTPKYPLDAATRQKSSFLLDGMLAHLEAYVGSC